MTIKKGLGRGLNTLIPVVDDNDSKVDELKTVNRLKSKKNNEEKIKISDIEPNKEQPRKQFNEDALQELAESIKQFGVIQPLIVQKRDNYYELIAGERRWRAARIAGLKEVPVIIRDYTEKEIVEIALIENIQREDLNPIEEALAYQRLINEYSMKQDEVANRVSKSRAAITNSIRLLKLDKKVQQMLIDEMISSGHARALLSIDSKEIQRELADKIFDNKLSVRDTEKLVKKVLNNEQNTKNESNESKNKNLSLIYKEIENNLKDIMGTKVLIKNKDDNRGKIEIEYYSQDELERIVDIFNSSKTN